MKQMPTPANRKARGTPRPTSPAAPAPAADIARAGDMSAMDSAIVSRTRSSLRSFGACSDIRDHILLWLAKWCAQWCYQAEVLEKRCFVMIEFTIYEQFVRRQMDSIVCRSGRARVDGDGGRRAGLCAVCCHAAHRQPGARARRRATGPKTREPYIDHRCGARAVGLGGPAAPR